MDNTPLLRRTPLYPNETLPSLLARLTQLNLLTSIYRLEHLVRQRLKQKGLHNDHFARPRQATTYTILSDLTQLPVSELYQSSGHPLADVLTPPGMTVWERPLPNGSNVSMLLSAAILRDHLYTERAIQFCPHCLRDRGYVPLEWMSRLVTVCTDHRCLLVTRCPCCPCPVSINDLIQGVCRHCQHRYRDIPTVAVSIESLGLRSQHWLRHWLGLGKDAMSDQPLADQLPRAVYSLVSGLRRCLLLTPVFKGLDHTLGLLEMSGDQRGHALSAVFNHRLTTMAIWTLLDWPHHFDQLLEMYAHMRGQSHILGPGGRLGVLYSIYLEGEYYWQHPSCVFIQTAFNAYLTRNSHAMRRMQNSHRYRDGSDLRDQFPGVGVGEAARILQVTQKKVRRLVREGRLSVVETAGGSVILARHAVLTLQKQWRRGFQGSETVAQFLGVPTITIRRLRQMDILPAEHVWENYWLYDGDAARSLRKELIARTRSRKTLTGPALTLQQVIHLPGYANRGGIPGILQLIRQKRLTPYHLSPKTMRCDELCFADTEVRHLLAELARD